MYCLHLNQVSFLAGQQLYLGKTDVSHTLHLIEKKSNMLSH